MPLTARLVSDTTANTVMSAFLHCPPLRQLGQLINPASLKAAEPANNTIEGIRPPKCEQPPLHS